MRDTKWVVSKYAPETGERFEVVSEFAIRYLVKVKEVDGRTYIFDFSKREYIPCHAPERWEKVPIEGEGCRAVLRAVDSLCAGNEHFRIVDGALILERRIA